VAINKVIKQTGQLQDRSALSLTYIITGVTTNWAKFIRIKAQKHKPQPKPLIYRKVASPTENNHAWAFGTRFAVCLISRQWIQERHGSRVICCQFYIHSPSAPTGWCCLQQFHWHLTICMQHATQLKCHILSLLHNFKMKT